MDECNITNGGRAPEVSDIHVVALYDPTTGKIAHVHTVTIFKGGRAVNERAAIEAAVAQAAKAGHQTDRLKVKVSKDPSHARSPHRIDVKTGEFVALPAVKHRR
jgi:hypothetical protein